MAKISYVALNEDHDGLEIRNFKLWLMTTAQSVVRLVASGLIGFDTDKQKVVVYADGAVKELTFLEDQKEITDDYTILTSDNRACVFINTGIGKEITIDTLPDDFYCELFNVGINSVTIAAGTATVQFPDGYILEAGKYCTLLVRNSTGVVYVKGELTS